MMLRASTCTCLPHHKFGIILNEACICKSDKLLSRLHSLLICSLLRIKIHHIEKLFVSMFTMFDVELHVHVSVYGLCTLFYREYG